MANKQEWKDILHLLKTGGGRYWYFTSEVVQLYEADSESSVVDVLTSAKAKYANVNSSARRALQQKGKEFLIETLNKHQMQILNLPPNIIEHLIDNENEDNENENNEHDNDNANSGMF